jgi:adenylate kinase
VGKDVIVIMGPPGAGKSSQAKRMGERTGFAHIATGDLARSVTDPNLAAAVRRGELLDSKVMDLLLKEELERVSPEQVVILDGFPRRREDAQWLQAELPRLNRRLRKAIFLVIEPEESKRRNLLRGRPDDSIEAQAERWREYTEETLPVVEEYRRTGLLAEVNGTGSQEEVARRIRGAIDG